MWGGETRHRVPCCQLRIEDMPSILVVDDMAIFREPVAAALQRQGYHTVCACDGTEAVSAVIRKQSDLILLDVQMPGIDGIETLRRIRALTCSGDIPVIMLTISTDMELVREAGKLRVCGWIPKSMFTLADLLARIEKALPTSIPSADTPAVSSADSGEAAEAPANPSQPDAGSQEVSASKPDKACLSIEGESLKDLKPIMRRSEVQEVLDDCGELKGLSPTVAQVLRMSREKNCSIEGIAKAIKQDHAISLKILKLANSAVYTRGEPVDSVQKAVMRIGLNQIHQTVMNISVVEKFSGIEEDERLNSPQFWEHSIATGLIAAEISRKLGAGEEDIDSAFTMGLLHDVGRMVYAEMIGDKYLQLLDVAQRLQLPLEQVESRLLLINHADAMDRVLHGWRFPKALVDPIAFHHLSVGNIRRTAPKSFQQTATLALANRIAHALLLGSSGNLVLYPIEEFLQILKLDGRLVQQLEDEVPDHTTDIKLAMLSRSSGQAWPEMRAKLRKQFKQAFRPVFVSHHAEIDAVRILCNRLGDPLNEDEGPNIAVVHLNHVRERIPTTKAVRDAEREAGVGTLPLVILSANGNLQLEDRAMAGRAFQLLPYPVTVNRFIDAVNTVSAKGATEAAA